MNFNQFTAAAAAAAASNSGNMNLNNFTSAVSSILANSNIDLSQLGLGNLAAMSSLGSAVQPPPQSSRHNLQQAHHNRSGNSTGASLNSNTHLTNSMSNLANADPQTVAAITSMAGLPASLSNLTSTSLADLAAHQATAPSSRSSIQSAHHRGSSNHNQNHHSSISQITAAHQSTSAAKALAAHQSQSTNLHHRHSSSHNAHNSSSSYSNHHISNNISKNNINTLNVNLNNNINNSSSGGINNNNMNNNNNMINNNVNNNTATSSQIIIATNNSNSVTPPKNSTCYKTGDCVYFEPSPSMPLQIGKIDEICKLNGDIIEVKVVSFFRRRDISSSLMTLADKYQYDESQEEEIKQMSEKDKNLLKQRELFYSRQIETIPASAIRGKCIVQLLNESESLASYLSQEDHYFYTLLYDPQQKTITADRGEIRVGQRYQAEVQPSPVYSPQSGGDPTDSRDLDEMETLVYTPDHSLTDDEINKFLTIAKSVGTFARALDCSSSIKQPSLHLTAASASRDVTLLYAMQLLHSNNYDLGKAVCALVPSTGPVLCRDEIEEWTAGEATLFEEAIEKYGREFNEIRQDFLPWKSVKNIVEYYYMWKTTDRSINQRRMKALEAENKVSVLYITDPENELKKATSNNLATTSSTDVTNSYDSGKKPVKRPQESDEPTITVPIPEGTNATLKRRQVTEQLPKHTTPGENLRFIATPRYKKTRAELITRKQWRHLSRRPWERRVKSKS